MATKLFFGSLLKFIACGCSLEFQTSTAWEMGFGLGLLFWTACGRRLERVQFLEVRPL